MRSLKEVRMPYTGPERRKYPRINARFIVSYRVLGEPENIDITQTKNVGLGGMLLTTNRQFKVGTNIALEIRLPFDPNPIMIIGKVLESHEITKNLIYDTRLFFLAIDEKHKGIVKQTVDYYLKKTG
jgi:Tfp pilus assembly protein PilZ